MLECLDIGSEMLNNHNSHKLHKERFWKRLLMRWVQSTTSAGKQFFKIFWHPEKTSLSATWKLNT